MFGADHDVPRNTLKKHRLTAVREDDWLFCSSCDHVDKQPMGAAPAFVAGTACEI
jgi:hypothetical protein